MLLSMLTSSRAVLFVSNRPPCRCQAGIPGCCQCCWQGQTSRRSQALRYIGGSCSSVGVIIPVPTFHLGPRAPGAALRNGCCCGRITTCTHTSDPTHCLGPAACLDVHNSLCVMGVSCPPGHFGECYLFNITLRCSCASSCLQAGTTALVMLRNRLLKQVGNGVWFDEQLYKCRVSFRCMQPDSCWSPTYLHRCSSEGSGQHLSSSEPATSGTSSTWPVVACKAAKPGCKV